MFTAVHTPTCHACTPKCSFSRKARKETTTVHHAITRAMLSWVCVMQSQPYTERIPPAHAPLLKHMMTGQLEQGVPIQAMMMNPPPFQNPLQPPDKMQRRPLHKHQVCFLSLSISGFGYSSCHQQCCTCKISLIFFGTAAVEKHYVCRLSLTSMSDVFSVMLVGLHAGLDVLLQHKQSDSGCTSWKCIAAITSLTC